MKYIKGVGRQIYDHEILQVKEKEKVLGEQENQ